MKKMLVISDVHGNWPALEAVLAAERDFDEVVCCGDIVDYGPDPVQCLHWIQSNARHVVRGNHDNALGFERDCKCMGSFREMSLATRAWHRRLLTEADIEYLRSLPTIDWFRFERRHFRMAHATPQGDMFEYLTPSQWSSHVVGIDENFVLLGHTHVQGIRSIGGTTVINPGSVGLARDRAGEACYAVYQAGSFSLRRIPYEVRRTVGELRRSPLPPTIVDCLAAALEPLDMT